MRNDWVEIIRAARVAGMRCAVQIGERNFTAARLAAAVEAGVQAIGVSIDGLAPLRD